MGDNKIRKEDSISQGSSPRISNIRLGLNCSGKAVRVVGRPRSATAKTCTGVARTATCCTRT